MWREALDAVQARVPRQLAVWENNTLTIDCPDLVGHDLVIKLDNSYVFVSFTSLVVDCIIGMVDSGIAFDSERVDC